MPAMTRKILRSPASIYAGLLLVCAIIVSPVADFPLNDDWVYAKMAQDTLDARAYVVHPFAASNAAFHALVGAGVIGLVGDSHTALRLSTLVFAFVTVFCVQGAAREAGASRNASLLAGFVVWANPLFLNLAYTFMTDVPFLALLAASTWGYVRAMRTGHPRDLALGSAFAALAMLQRQMGVLQPAVLIIAWAIVFARRRSWPSAAQVAAFAAPLVIGAGLYMWTQRSSGGLYTWPNAWREAPVTIIVLQILRYVFASWIYLGLFLLPFAAAWVVRLIQRPRSWSIMRSYWAAMILVWLAMFGCGFLLMPRPAPLPLLTNMMRNLGVGPITLHDTTHIAPGWGPIQLGGVVWWGITAVAMLAGTVLAIELIARMIWPALRAKKMPARAAAHIRHAQYLFLAGTAAAQILVLQNPWIALMFDRYLLPSLVVLAILGAVFLTRLQSRVATSATALATVAMLAFSLVALQDYLAWNRARWEAIEIVRTEYGARDDQIEGGYEFNGKYTSDHYMEVHNTTHLDAYGPYGWWTFNPEYAISMLPRENFEWVRDVPYYSWLGMEERRITVLKRVRGHSGRSGRTFN